jgi:hypothetical protein
VVPRGDVILQLSENIPAEIRNKLVVKLRTAEQTQPATNQTQSTPQPTPIEPQQIDYVIPENDYLVLRMPANLDLTTYASSYQWRFRCNSGQAAQARSRLYQFSVLASTLNLLVPIIISGRSLGSSIRTPQGQPRHTFWASCCSSPKTRRIVCRALSLSHGWWSSSVLSLSLLCPWLRGTSLGLPEPGKCYLHVPYQPRHN